MSWKDIHGHDAWVQAFARVARQHRLAHAYLFVGPDGIGKTLFARELAKTLLCEQPADNFAACTRCSACTLVDAGTHPDLFLVDKPADSNEMPIELMRELGRGFGLKPARGRGKIAILGAADDLNEESANCFLKTLEEPPPRSLFILIGTSPDRQLATILSRCHVVRFAPLPEEPVRQILAGRGVEEPLLSRALRLGAGSPGAALALADPVLWQFRQTLLEGLLRPGTNPVELAKAWTHFVDEAGKEAALQRVRARLTVRLVTEFLSDALACALGGAPRLDDAGERVLLDALTARATPETIMAILERALETGRHIDRYIQLALVLEAFLDACAQLLAGPR